MAVPRFRPGTGALAEWLKRPSLIAHCLIAPSLTTVSRCRAKRQRRKRQLPPRARNVDGAASLEDGQQSNFVITPSADRAEN
jgi:hypothetical protein